MDKKNLNEIEMIKKSKGQDIKVIYLIIITIVSLFAPIYFFKENGFNFSWIIMICMLIICLFWDWINDKLRLSKIKKALIKKFGKNNIIINRRPKSMVVDKYKTQIGNRRNKYAFSIFIKNCNCEFNCYSEKILNVHQDFGYTKYDIRYNRRYHYKYEKRQYINEYIYSLKKIGITATDVNLRCIMDKIKYSKSVPITISFIGNDLIIRKETMKNNYSKIFAEIDVNDVDFFYNFIIEDLKEVNLKGNKN